MRAEQRSYVDPYHDRAALLKRAVEHGTIEIRLRVPALKLQVVLAFILARGTEENPFDNGSRAGRTFDNRRQRAVVYRCQRVGNLIVRDYVGASA